MQRDEALRKCYLEVSQSSSAVEVMRLNAARSERMACTHEVQQLVMRDFSAAPLTASSEVSELTNEQAMAALRATYAGASSPALGSTVPTNANHLLPPVRSLPPTPLSVQPLRRAAMPAHSSHLGAAPSSAPLVSPSRWAIGSNLAEDPPKPTLAPSMVSLQLPLPMHPPPTSNSRPGGIRRGLAGLRRAAISTPRSRGPLSSVHDGHASGSSSGDPVSDNGGARYSADGGGGDSADGGAREEIVRSLVKPHNRGKGIGTCSDTDINGKVAATCIGLGGSVSADVATATATKDTIETLPLEATKQQAAHEAAAWVAAVLQIEPPADCEDTLHLWLKSGELLCEVLNRVMPGTIRKVTTSAMPFKQMENIAYYVEACASLGVPSQDLFQTVDLYEAKDMRAVVRNIHSLGRVVQRLESFEGPCLGAKLAERNARSFSEEQLAEARAMPARWTNVGKAGIMAGK